MDFPSDNGPTTCPSGRSLDDLSVEGRVQLASLERRLFDTTSEPVRIGRFVILNVLGRGAMGTVYRAYDPDLDRRIAIKVLGSSDDRSRDRIRREATALARLAHPNIVTIHEVGEDEAGVFVAMEYVDGGTLDEWCEQHPTPSHERTRQLLAFALQATQGLIAAHERGLVHRDIKPANILIGTDGRLRLADFGLARSVTTAEPDAVTLDGDSQRTTQSRSTTFAGTPAYMPPEQFDGITDAQSDQFSLCASLYEALYGVRPYRARSIPELLDAFERGRLVPVGGHSVPSYVFSVLERGLAPDPSRRHPDMRALQRALQTGRRRRSVVFGASGTLAILGLASSAILLSRPAPCRADRESVDAVIEGHRSEVRGALLDSGVLHIEETWDRAAATLDQLAQRYAIQSLEACRVSRSPDPERAVLGKRRLACLEQARTTLDEALAGAHILDERRARAFLDVTDVLLDATDCADPPEELYDSGLGQTLLAAHWRGQFAQTSFEPERARRSFESILERTKPGQLARLRAQTHLRLSELDAAEGDDAGVRRHTMAMLDEALAAGDPDLTALGWIYAAGLIPEDTDWTTVEMFLDRATRLEATGKLDDATRAELDHQRARVLSARGRAAEAIERIRRAIDRAEPIHHDSLPAMNYELSTMSLYEGDIAGALSAAVRAREGFEARLGPHHPMVAAVTLRIAEAEGFGGDERAALRTLGGAIGILEAAPDYNAANLATAYASRAMSHHSLGEYDEAISDLERSLQFEFEPAEARERHRLRTHVDLARTLSLAGRPESALPHLDRAMPGLAEAVDLATRSAHADASILRAMVLAQLDRDDESLRQLGAARSLVDEVFPSGSIPRIQAIIELADVLRELGHHDDALELLDAQLRSEGELDPVWRGRLEAQRAFTHETAGDDAAALEWGDRALERLTERGYTGTEAADLRTLVTRLSD